MSTSEEADAWWESLPPRRRVQIQKWIQAPEDTGPIPGQLALIKEDENE